MNKRDCNCLIWVIAAWVVLVASIGITFYNKAEACCQTTTTTNNNYTYNNEVSTGTALAIATAQHQFMWGSDAWQGSVGLGHFDSRDAISLGVGKRFDRVLLNGSIAREGNKTGYGAGINWRF